MTEVVVKSHDIKILNFYFSLLNVVLERKTTRYGVAFGVGETLGKAFAYELSRLIR